MSGTGVPEGVDVAALRESEALFRRAFEEAPIGVALTSVDGSLSRVNLAFADLLGYPARELAALPWAKLTHPEDVPASAELFRALLAGEASSGKLEKRYLARDGRVVWAIVQITLLRDGSGRPVHFATHVLDISERKRAEESLRQGEERFRKAVEASPFPIMIHAEDGAVLQVNRAWTEITGWSREELATIADWTERAYGQRGESVKGYIEGLYALDGPVDEGDYVVATASGGRRTWQFSSAPLGPVAGGRRAVISTAVDVTERRRAEAEVRSFAAELERRVEQRTAELEMRRQESEAFAYSVSHDLRAPLRAIDGFSAELGRALEGRLGEEEGHLLETVRANVKRMELLIEDLLAFSRAVRQPLERQIVATAPLVEAVVRDVLASAKGTRAQVRLGPVPEAWADPALLRQVWENLLSNALKFSATREEPVVEVRGRVEGDAAVFEVADNGVGFDERYAGKLFGVFQRLHGREFEGTGIGLALVRSIVERHGGAVSASSKPHAGATFRFSLPFAEAARP